MSHWPWSVLGIEPTDDKGAIRKAYADKLKSLDIDNEINAYSDLRQARDSALANVGYNVPGDDEGDVSDDYSYDYDDADDFNIEFSAADLRDFGFDILGTPSLDSFGQGHVPQSSPDLTAIDGGAPESTLGTADKDLARLLFPAGEHSDDAMEWAEFEEAKTALATILDHAGQVDIQTEQAIDYWLSDILAEAWPRSAPLVEQASERFGWMSEQGRLSERPALAWLNARLGGMRFHEAVQRPGHPHFPAWKYLSDPGTYRWWHRVHVSGDKASAFISEIRAGYPEIESYLEPRKVAAMEEGVTGFVPGLIRLLFVLFVLTIPLRYCAGLMGPPDAPPDIESAFALSDAAQEEAESIVDELFGEAATLAQVESQNDLIAKRIKVSAMILSSNVDVFPNAHQGPETLVRGLILHAVSKAEFRELVAIKQLKLDLLRVARGVGDDACVQFILGGELDPAATLNEAIRERERVLARSLLEQGLLVPEDNPDSSAQASVPGPVVGEVMQSTGLSQDAVGKALGDAEASGACDVQIALYEAMLRQPGKMPIELLRLR